MTHHQQLDNPVTAQEQDAFNRWTFSKRLADTVARFDAREGSPVIGIYGKWGSGKSSVLNFIKSELRNSYADVAVLVEFNPWLFKDTESLLQGFFASLNLAMMKSQDGLGRSIGDRLKRYSGVFGLIPVVGTGASKLAEQIGKELTEQGVDKSRDEVRAMMKTAPRKIVVLIDDLDRLDRDEILLMLKIVRLAGSFPNVIYLLAFDDEMVGRAVGEKYGGGDGGRQFLEKIVQYPFTLPAVPREQLLAFVEQQARLACAEAGLGLADDGWQTFRELVRDCLARRLATPRQAIRYGNALRFSLAMMRGEVDVLDQLGAEALRILYPDLHAMVRDNKELFTLSDWGDHPVFDATADRPLAHTRTKSVDDLDARIRSAMAGASDDEIADGRRLLERLFWPRRPRPQGIGLTRYFDRYLTLAVPANQIGDGEVARLLAAATPRAPRDRLLRELVERNPRELIDLLLRQVAQLDLPQTIALATLLIRSAELLDARGAVEGPRLAHLLAHLVLHAADQSEAVAGTGAEDLLRLAVERLAPVELALAFADELDRAAGQRRRRSEGSPGMQAAALDEGDWAAIRDSLAIRLKTEAERDWRAMLADRPGRSTWLREWQRVAPADQRRWLAETLAAYPEAIPVLLRSYVKDVSELGFSVNQEAILETADVDALAQAARAYAAAARPEDRQTIATFLAWYDGLERPSAAGA